VKFWNKSPITHTYNIITATQCQIQRPVGLLSGCLASNRLLLNPTKTQFILLGCRRRLTNVDQCLVTETFPHLVFCDTVHDLGIILDQELNFSVHINQLTHSCYYQLRQLRTVSRSLSHDAAATLSMLLLLVGLIIAARF